MGIGFYLVFAALHSLGSLAQAADRNLVFNEKILPFSDWRAQSPNEAEVLNLFPGFREPVVELSDGGIRKSKQLKMILYSTRAKVVANRAAVNIHLPALIAEPSFRKLDPEAKHRKISASQTMPAVVGRGGAISNFGWCNRNPKKPDIFLPALERTQSHMIRPDRPWCQADSRTNCFESCRLVPPNSAIEAVIAAYNQVKSPGKDFGMATQSEVRYYVSESEFGAKFPLASLTGVQTPVSGILEISLFYVNQIMLYGKMLVVLQADPKDGQKTILTGLTAFGVREDAWNHKIGGGRVQALLKSKSSMNADSGILAGVPEFSKNALLGFAALVEK